MFMCTTRFDIEEKQLAFVRDFLTKEEKAIAEEERDAQDPDNDLVDLISDDELEPEDTPGLIVPVILPRSSQKRRRDDDLGTEVEEGDEDSDHDAAAAPFTDSEDDDLPIDIVLLGESGTQRASKRVRTRSRLLDGYEVPKHF